MVTALKAHSLDAIEAAQNADVLIYAVRYTELKHGKIDARDRYGMRALNHLGTQTGGKTFDFHSYEGAGHAFFSVDRSAYRLDAAKDGWKQIWSFFGTHLKGA